MIFLDCIHNCMKVIKMLVFHTKTVFPVIGKFSIVQITKQLFWMGFISSFFLSKWIQLYFPTCKLRCFVIVRFIFKTAWAQLIFSLIFDDKKGIIFEVAKFISRQLKMWLKLKMIEMILVGNFRVFKRDWQNSALSVF